MIKELVGTTVDKLDKYRVGIGTGLFVVIILMWGSYELGSMGWNQLNIRFVDHAEAADHVTFNDIVIMDKKKNVRILKGKILDYKVDRAYADSEEGKEAVVAQIDENIIRITGTIEEEEESITCLEEAQASEDDTYNCEL